MSSEVPQEGERVLFLTGRLAEHALRQVLAKLEAEFDCDVVVLPISVAALMHAGWVRRKLEGVGSEKGTRYNWVRKSERYN